MIRIYGQEEKGLWFGLAYVQEKIVATALNSTREKTIRTLLKTLPPNSELQLDEKGSEFAQKTVAMLMELHAGNEEHKSFTLSTEYIPQPDLKVLEAAAAIPIGYVTSYGNIAEIASTEPRLVGRIMATNPLYPIVPCHRVVGADFSLVGYGGGKGLQALQTKLERLSKETRGFTAKKEVSTSGKSLTVYPVEHVVRKAEKDGLGLFYQRQLFDK